MQSRKLSLGLAAGAIVAAVVLFVVLNGNDGSDGSGSSSSAGTGGTTKSSSAGPAAAKISFENGSPVGGVREIEVAKGDPVRFEVTPDVPAEVHIHGYELEKDVDAGKTATFEFPATAEGVFEVEVHRLVHGEAEEAGVQVAELTVTP
jgi:FtsP/CotA-like multicopper oxidase with cupredoxin domain